MRDIGAITGSGIDRRPGDLPDSLDFGRSYMYRVMRAAGPLWRSIRAYGSIVEKG